MARSVALLIFASEAKTSWASRSPRTRRRIRPVPTPSSSHERRTGARRHAAGSWNGRCGAPRTNGHDPLLCAAAPLRGVARALSGAIRKWFWPAPPPLTRVVWQGGARGTFVTRRRRATCATTESLGRGGLHIPRWTRSAPRCCERQRPGGGGLKPRQSVFDTPARGRSGILPFCHSSSSRPIGTKFRHETTPGGHSPGLPKDAANRVLLSDRAFRRCGAGTAPGGFSR